MLAERQRLCFDTRAIRFSFHEAYQVALSREHPYPIGKYPLLQIRLLEEGVRAQPDILQPASIDVLARIRTREYLRKVAAGGALPAAPTAPAEVIAGNIA